MMEFDVKAEPFEPDTSEESVRLNTHPEALRNLIDAYLSTMTGLPWVVRVTLREVEPMGELLTVHAEVVMSVAKDRVGGPAEFLAQPVDKLAPT